MSIREWCNDHPKGSRRKRVEMTRPPLSQELVEESLNLVKSLQNQKRREEKRREEKRREEKRREEKRREEQQYFYMREGVRYGLIPMAT